MTEREIFFAALDKDDAAQRARYLDAACAGDAVLRRRIEALLGSNDSADGFMDVPVVEQLVDDGAPTLEFLTPSQKPGSLGRLEHFEVLAVIGMGGMGIVLKALDEKLQRVVAVKVLARRLAASGAARKRFIREAQAAAAVSHDHVIAIHAVEDAGPVPYLVMEFIDGPSLEEKLRTDGPLDVKEVLRIGMQIASGLAAAHKQGLIHRDVKPANILLANGVERVKITDFGLARAVDDASFSQSQGVAGTPDYMSPEQANGGPVDHRSDLFSLGSVLYALCTGRPPFRAGSTLAVLKRVGAETPQPPRELNADVPPWLEALLGRLHAKEPSDRFQSAGEVAELLSRHLAELQQPPADTPVLAVRRESRTETHGPHKRSRLLRSSVLCLTFALLGSVAGYEIFRNRAGGIADPGPIRVGILHSQTGTMGASESAAIDATLLAIEEINQKGGLLGRKIEPVVADGMSDWPTYAREAERLISAERVCTIFGCWTSASRKAVRTVVEKHDHLLIYPMQYEGLEQSPQIVYTGAVPNQQVTPAVRWCLSNLGKRFFIVGSDYIWPRATSEVIHDIVAECGGEIVGEAYLPLESLDVDGVVRKIRQSNPEVILEMVAGDSKVAYYRTLRRFGITSAKVPTMSFSSAQPGLAVKDIAGDYAAWNYFESIDSPTNHAFVERFRAKFGPQRLLSDPLEASYVGVHLWAQAVRAAGKADAAAIRAAMAGQGLSAPQGQVHVDAKTQHLWQTARVARISSTGTAEVVWTSGEPVEPVPFPASRSRGQWERLLTDLNQRWGGQWASEGLRLKPYKPRSAPTPEELAKLPAAADALRREDISQERLDQAVREAQSDLPELVAILGADRHRDGSNKYCQLYSAAFSPDGKILATGGLDKIVRLWDAATGSLRRELTGHAHPDVFNVYTLAFSPDGKVLASGDREGTIHLWESTTGQHLRTLRATGGTLLQVAFSPDSTVLAAARDTGAVQLWDARTGDLLSSLTGGKATIYCVAFSPDGQLLATAGRERIIRVWDLTKSTLHGELQGHTGDARCLLFHPDGCTLASAGHDKVIRLWDVPSLSSKGVLQGHDSTVLAGAWRADGAMLITAGEIDGTVRLWNAASDPPRCEVLKVMPPAVPWLHALALSPEGRHLAVTHPNGSVYILRLAKLGEVRRVP
jgi:urea transport system substrate-binding protein